VIDSDTFPDFDQFVPVEEPPKPIDIPEPVFPEKAMQAGTGGEVWINALIDKHGVVRKAMIVKEPGLGLGFSEAAQMAAMKGKWSPALQNGYPVAYWVKYKVEFKFPPENGRK
jgi:TonB family protein